MPDLRNHSPASWQTLVFATGAYFTEPSPASSALESSLGISAHIRQRPATSACLEPLTNCVRKTCGGVHRSSTAELDVSPGRGRPPGHRIRWRYLLPVPFLQSLEFPRKPSVDSTGTLDAHPHWHPLPKRTAPPTRSRFAPAPPPPPPHLTPSTHPHQP